MIKKNFWKITIITLFILLINTKVSKAAISASSKTVNSGESVSISISSNVPVLSYKVTMNSSGGLTFVTSSGGTGAGTATITDAKSTGMTSLATYTFKAPTVTTDTTYTVSFTATAMEDENFNPVANSTATATIKVKAPATPVNPPANNNSGTGGNSNTNNGSSGTSNNKPNTSTPETQKSNDSTLKSLVVEGYELYPEFNVQIKEYSLKVGNDVTSVNILPTVNDSKATYKIDGTYQELVVGENVINVLVTAEDGTTNTYIIKITREREALKLITLKISYIDEEGNVKELKLNPELSEGVFEYTLEDLSYLISKLDVEVLTNLENAKIEIVGNEKLNEGENIITIKLTMASESEEEEDEVLTYTIKVNREKAPVVTPIGKIKNWFKGITGTISTWCGENQYKIIMGALMLCSACMGGISVYLVYEYKKYRLLIQKVAEITRMNRTNESVPQTVGVTEDLNNEVEEIESEDNEEIKTKGKHF